MSDHAAFEAWMNEAIDAFLDGQPIRRRTSYDSLGMAHSEHAFNAGWQAARRDPTTRQSALEEAAQVCDEVAAIMVNGSYEQGTAEICADKVRALAGKAEGGQ